VTIETTAPPAVTFTAAYTESIAKEAVAEYVKRRLLKNWTLWMLMLVSAGWAIYLWHLQQSFWAGILTVVAILPIILVVIVWRAHWTNTVGKFRRLRNPEAMFSFENGRMLVRSSEGEGTIPIAGIKEIWKLKDFWMLFVTANSFMTLPVRQLDADTLAILEAHLAGTKQGGSFHGERALVDSAR
jgi:hypothetical protein